MLLDLRKQFTESWILGGNFNVVTGRSEKSNCVGVEYGSKEFCDFIERCNLLDSPLIGRKFIWFGLGNKRSRLDKFLMDELWILKYKDLKQEGFNRSVSNHIPIVLSNEEKDWGLRSFKFINGWLSKKDCLEMIEKEWSGLGRSNGYFSIKLWRLKGKLKQWNEKEGYNLEGNLKTLEYRLKEMDDLGEKRKLNESEEEEVRKLNTWLWEAIKLKESLWWKKSRMAWLKEGDSNSVFFHKAVKIRSKRKEIQGVMIREN